MPLSTDIRLPRAQTPRFPDRCCVCGRQRPGDVLTVTRRSGSFLDLFLPWLLIVRRPVRCEAPACATCRVEALRYRRFQLAVVAGAVALVLFLVLPWVGKWGLPRGTKRLVTLAVVCVVVSPLLAWWVLRPPAFDITPSKDAIDYEFRDPEYAREFAQHNAPGTSQDSAGVPGSQ